MENEEKNKYNHREVEPKWQKRWEEEKLYRAIDFDKKPKKYILVEFPYPSGERLHVGHAFSFTGTDVLARFSRMKGFNVLCPMGWDAFGLPAENYAIKTGVNPAITTQNNIANSKAQANKMALSFDWEREISTIDPNYYRWTQWIFIQLFKKGLALKEGKPINWCPSCKIGLANEEVVGGNCERCGTETSRRNISQWVVRITKYADRLIEGLKETAFIEKVKAAQINWIGRSEGVEIEFRITNYELRIKVFTTRPDTLYGATFMVLAPEHDLVGTLKNKEINEYVENSRKKSEMERTELAKEKTGIFSGLYAINPVNNKEIPIWISDFVLSTYGTGAIMAVPAHDERDFAFAKKFKLEIIPVIETEDKWDFNEKPYIDVNKGKAVNSSMWNGLTPSAAIEKATSWLGEKGVGKKTTSYHLRDWIFSRQHYWGEPIPMVFCKKCGWVPVPEEQLPIELPKVEKYEPTDTGESPLATMTDWVNTTCPKCGEKAKRETDTMPNWAGSDWYFLRYLDPHNDKVLVDLNKAEYWMPVDVYVGGDEHNTLHLLYSRFIYQFLWDLGFVPKKYPEPYFKRLSHGVILGPGGQRMSKSRGNVINPDEIINGFGADTLRTYMMFMGPFEATMAWNQEALEGCYRFLKRIWALVLRSTDNNLQTTVDNRPKTVDRKLERKLNQTIKKVGEDIGEMKFNTAVAAMMEFVNEMYNVQFTIYNEENKKIFEKFLQLLAPFAPFITEELWEKLGNKFSVHNSEWPKYDPELIEEEVVTIAVQVNGKLKGTIEVQSAKCKVQSEIEEASKKNEIVKRHLEGTEIKKVIFVPGKLINFVI